METKIYDTIIIGAGPAGLTAALYTSRGNMSTLILDKGIPGGQLHNTEEIENFPGFSYITGPDLADKMHEHALQFGAEYKYGDVKEITKDNDTKIFTINAGNNIYQAKSVIIATGTKYKKLGVPGEEEFTGKGVSWCAVCDGAFFRQKHLVVVGGGDSAVEEALYLTRFAKQVTVLHRRDKFRAQPILVDKLLSHPRIKVEYNVVVDEILGENKVTGVKVTQNWFQPITKILECDGVFEYVGMNPVSYFATDLGITDESGWIITDSKMQTSIDGLYAIGDIRKDTIRQVVTATGDGCVAAQMAQHYIESL